MKTAKQWQDELAGETSVESIREIQLDALTHAATLLTANADSRHRGFEAVMLEINKLSPPIVLVSEGADKNQAL
jgi:hypothetical protein